MATDPDNSLENLGSTPARKSGLVLRLLEVAGGLAVFVIVGAMMLPAVRSSGEPVRRTQCKNNLKQIGLALHNYHDAHNAFPPAYTVDADGKPLHSWRTLILPYVDQAPLYNKIDLSKAWDDPANAEAFKTRIPVYECPSTVGPANFTRYLALVGSNSCLRRTEPRPLSEIADDRAATLMVIEVGADHAVHWMAPTDADDNVVLGIGPQSKLSHMGGMHALFVDGATRFVSFNLSAEKRRALVSIAGGEDVGDF